MELQQFLLSLDKYNKDKSTSYELEDASYRVFHCLPRKRTDKRTFQQSWSKHPIDLWFKTLRKNSEHKGAIGACAKLAKEWWSKSTDTYLFPGAALAMFLAPEQEIEALPKTTEEKAFKIYRELLKSSGPTVFNRCYTYSDQHTAAGAYNGISKKNMLGPRIFALWNSAVRPLSDEHVNLLETYVFSKFPPMNPQLATLIKNHVDKLKSFGNGTCTEQELFVSVMKTLTALGSPIPIQWKDKPWPKAEYKDDVKHPLGSLYHFRHPVLPCGKHGLMMYWYLVYKKL